jgi:benzoate membrane transport protein
MKRIGGAIIMPIEPGTNVRKNMRDFFLHLSPARAGTGFVAAMFSIMGPALIVMNAAKEGNVPLEQAISWLFIIYVTGGVFTIILSLRYRLPIVTAYTIPGAVLIGSALKHIPFNEAIGAFMITGAVVTILGVSGLIKKAVEFLPLPVMLGMIAGVILSFGLNVIKSVVEEPAVGGSAFAVFFLFMAMKKISKWIPPILGAMLVGGFVATWMGKTNWSALGFSLATPIMVKPEFSFQAFFELTLPLIVLVIGVQNIQAIGVLYAVGYKPPVNAIFTVPGIGTLLNSLFGGHPCVIAGPSTAICSSDSAGENKDLRYIASVVDGLLWISFGLMAGMAIVAATIVPKQLLAVLGGLAMFGVFLTTFSQAFSGKFRSGAMVSFLISAANVTVLKVGAPFWALIVGFIVTLLLDRDDYTLIKNRSDREDEEQIAV